MNSKIANSINALKGLYVIERKIYTKELIIGNERINIVEADEQYKYLSDSDREMDARARQAVKAAIEKAEFCKKPVARYDIVNHKAYIEYPNGEKQYAE